MKSSLVTMVTLSHTVSQEKTGVFSRRQYVMDVKRTFLEDNVDEEIHINLRDEVGV